MADWNEPLYQRYGSPFEPYDRMLYYEPFKNENAAIQSLKFVAYLRRARAGYGFRDDVSDKPSKFPFFETGFRQFVTLDFYKIRARDDYVNGSIVYEIETFIFAIRNPESGEHNIQITQRWKKINGEDWWVVTVYGPYMSMIYSILNFDFTERREVIKKGSVTNGVFKELETIGILRDKFLDLLKIYEDDYDDRGYDFLKLPYSDNISDVMEKCPDVYHLTFQIAKELHEKYEMLEELLNKMPDGLKYFYAVGFETGDGTVQRIAMRSIRAIENKLTLLWNHEAKVSEFTIHFINAHLMGDYGILSPFERDLLKDPFDILPYYRDVLPQADRLREEIVVRVDLMRAMIHHPKEDYTPWLQQMRLKYSTMFDDKMDDEMPHPPAASKAKTK